MRVLKVRINPLRHLRLICFWFHWRRHWIPFRRDHGGMPLHCHFTRAAFPAAEEPRSKPGAGIPSGIPGLRNSVESI